MKQTFLFLILLVAFVALSVRLPEGMSLIPAINMRLQYTQEGSTTKIKVENLALNAGLPSMKEESATGSGIASEDH
ncbi:MAG: hypothetical protein V1926_04080 [Candidatus Peregrinibacteria bacterium]